MAYTFKSRSAASVTMLRANGDEILRLIGMAPAARGVIPVENLPAAIARIEAAIAPRAPSVGAAPSAPRSTAAQADEEDKPEIVTLRQRALPFLHLLREAQAAGEPVTWGVV